MGGYLLLFFLSRCAGHEVFRTDTVSRVHALLLRRDGELILADVGSTNGIWKGDTELRCTVVEPGVEYGLGMKASIAWEPLQ